MSLSKFREAESFTSESSTVELPSEPVSMEYGENSGSPIDLSKIDSLDNLLERKKKLEKRLASASPGEPLDVYQAQLEELKQKTRKYFEVKSREAVDSKSAGSPTHEDEEEEDVSGGEEEEAPVALQAGLVRKAKSVLKEQDSSLEEQQEKKKQYEQESESSSGATPVKGEKKKPSRPSMVRKIPTDFKIVNLVKKKKRFDGMTFKLDNSFTISAKEIIIGKESTPYETISIERHFLVKHPNGDGAMIPKVSPLNLPRNSLESLIQAVRAIVNSRDLLFNSLEMPEANRDGIYDLGFMTKGLFTRDRFIIHKQYSLQVEEIQFSNARGHGVFDVLAITKNLGSIDKVTKKPKTFVQQIPVRLLPGLLFALQCIAKHTRQVTKTLNAAGEVEEMTEE